MTRLIERYKNGETKAVWADILSLEQAAFKPQNFAEIEAVMIETFERTAYNLEIIYAELQKLNYTFFARALHKPLPDVDKLLAKLDKAVKPFGYVPLSLKYFYKIVGDVNFAWNYFENKNFIWEMSDPLQILGLDELLGCMDSGDWQDMMKDYASDEDSGAFLELSADDYHKDNVSGGMSYSLKITENPCIDSAFLFERHETTFVDYLRICFEHCAFAGEPQEESYKDFVARVKPRLKEI